MRDVLLRAGEDFRLKILWQITMECSEDPKTDAENEEKGWSHMIPEFLRDAWPRQKKVRPPAASARLFKILFANPAHFLELEPIIRSS
uniref:Uncharacterized protein n=1 Tax=Candidatus Kentrum sp. TC TaxID=2126339 RepID=A0A451AAR6_9GAMM|nr:MAG: hypothetical protein BECKTC1821F_GA0114240_108612 [Candidatus Kentron sp. TC]